MQACASCFNHSQVGYKLCRVLAGSERNTSFNPSQVGYKPHTVKVEPVGDRSFNPSQVGYKHPNLAFNYIAAFIVSIPHR